MLLFEEVCMVDVLMFGSLLFALLNINNHSVLSDVSIKRLRFLFKLSQRLD